MNREACRSIDYAIRVDEAKETYQAGSYEETSDGVADTQNEFATEQDESYLIILERQL